MTMNRIAAGIALLAAGLGATQASAQITRSSILDLGSAAAMRPEVQSRYDAALALTQDAAVVRGTDSRYILASEAKIACGIAIGFLKTSTIDAENINKCDDLSKRMMLVDAPRPEPTPPPVVEKPAECNTPVPIFFDFDIDVPPAESRDVLARLAGSVSVCGWSSLVIAGHTDRAGSDAYNLALSQRRARNIADILQSNGVPSAMLVIEAKGETNLAIETLDGVRDPMNRRVTITPNSSAAQ